MSWRKSTPHNNNHRYVYEFKIIIKNYYHVAGVNSSVLSVKKNTVKKHSTLPLYIFIDSQQPQPCVTSFLYFRKRFRAMAGVDINPTK